jgi:hypothetical protein
MLRTLFWYREYRGYRYYTLLDNFDSHSMCVPFDITEFLIKIRVSHQFVDNSLFSHLLSVDRFVDQSSTMDNKRDEQNIEDDEYRYDHVDNKHCLKVHMKQVQNRLTKENHKCHYHSQLLCENNHMHYASHIDYIEARYDTLELQFHQQRRIKPARLE